MRFELELDQSMLGNMQNSLQSYDLMDNFKYKRISKLLMIMNETFGYN